MTFGERLKLEREKKGLSKGELSKMIGLHYTQLGRYENNKATPKSDALRKIANALDLTTDYLMSGSVSDLAEDRISDKKLISSFQKISTLSDESQKVVVALIDAFIFQQEMKDRLAS
jgi:transcriptional regulator with XRE-family HTH domain